MRYKNILLLAVAVARGAARCQRPPVRGAGLTNLYCVCVLRSRQLGVGEGTGGGPAGGGVK